MSVPTEDLEPIQNLLYRCECGATYATEMSLLQHKGHKHGNEKEVEGINHNSAMEW